MGNKYFIRSECVSELIPSGGVLTAAHVVGSGIRRFGATILADDEPGADAIPRWSEESTMGMKYRLENPGHPGGDVRRNIIEPRNLTVMDAASLLDVTRQALFDVLDEKTGLTPELALRIEAVFGVEMETLMEMQTAFDIADMRKRCQNLRSELAARARSHVAAAEPPEASLVNPRIIRRGHILG